MTPKSVRGRSEGVPGAFAKVTQKTAPKTKPKGSQIGAQMGAKIEPKMSPKTRSLPGGALGRPRVEKGAKNEPTWSQNGSSFREKLRRFAHLFWNAFRMVLALFTERFLEHN